MKNDTWIPLKLRENAGDSIDAWQKFDGPSVGWCFVGDSPIKSEADMI